MRRVPPLPQAFVEFGGVCDDSSGLGSMGQLTQCNAIAQIVEVDTDKIGAFAEPSSQFKHASEVGRCARRNISARIAEING